MAARKVTITLTNNIVAHYEARSYPDDDFNNDGLWELYRVPVYEIVITGTDDGGSAATYTHQAPRFMPYFNDKAKPDRHYKARGFLDSGLSAKRTVIVQRYKKDYEVQNRYSPGKGAIVLKGAFYIHAGPADLADIAFGSAGCVEIIGNYDDFKANIASLSGTGAKDSDEAIIKLVSARKLIVEIEQARAPDIKKLFTRAVKPF